MKSFVAATSLAILLTACGGGGGGGGGQGQASYDTLANRGNVLVGKIDVENITSADLMPTAGTATYSGVAGIGPSFEDEAELMSEAMLTANFGEASISGSLTNFRDMSNAAIPGAVSIHSGLIAENAFGAVVDGTLTIDGVTAPVDGTVRGYFTESDASGVFGVIEGSIDDEAVVGAIVLEK